MDVQYRNPDITLVNNQTALAKSDTAGRIEVVGSISPAPAVNESLYASGYGLQAVTAGALSLMKLYVGLNAPLVGVGPFYVVIVDTGVPLVGGEFSVIPTPPMTAAGSFFFWEPPGGAKFATGIGVAISSTPLLYTVTAETCAVSLWTVP